MSSFRRPKSEASLRLYNLPRRELQTLCKQYGIPANKTNVAMADALSACIPADNAKPKASVVPSSLGVSKTTPMKHKLEKKIGLPENSLAAFILSGKKKVSPITLAKQPTEAEDVSFPKPNTTPLKRGVKRSERPIQALQEEKSKVTTVPAFTRAAALQDKFGNTASAAHHGRLREAAPAVSSPKPRASTPRKRPAEAAAVVTRRGGDTLPPVSFYDLVSTPKNSQVHEIIELNSTGKTTKKMKTRLGLRAGPQEEEATLPLSNAAGVANKVSRGKRVAFADEVELQKNASPDPEPQLELETETIKISYTEIEFKDATIHKELFGLQRNMTAEEEQDVPPALNEELAPSLKEEMEHRRDASDSTQEAGFEFRDMALHKEIFGSHQTIESNCEETVRSPLDLEHAGTSACAIELDPLYGISNSPMSSPSAVNHSNIIPEQDHPVLSSICEDASEGSDSRGEALEVHTERHLQQSCDPCPPMDELSCDNLAENRSEKIIEVPDHSHATSPGCFVSEMKSDIPLSLKQEPGVIFSSADVQLAIDQEIDLEDTQQHQSENHDVMLVNEMGNESSEKECSEEMLVSSVSALDEGQIVCSGSTPEVNEVQRSPQELVGKEKLETSPSVASARGMVTAGPELVMSSPSSFDIPVTPVTKLQDNGDSPLAKAVTPLSKIQSNIDSTLAKATSILEKLTAWRADAEKKRREGFWEPKFSTVVENSSAAAVAEKPIAKTVSAVDRDIPSAKKARPLPKSILGSEKGLTVCEDADILSKGEMPSAKKIRTSDESTGFSEETDKENQSDKSIEDKSFRRFGGIGKDKKKHGKKFEVLKDRSKNLPDHTNALATIKESTGLVRPGDMSLRKLRAQVKQKVIQLETSKASPLRSQKSWNTSH